MIRKESPLREIIKLWRKSGGNICFHSSSSIKHQLFDKILIANRGEIACRVVRTAKKLGIKTVAVFSDVDKNSLHVSMADEAYCIGTAPSQDSYLRMERIIDVCKKSGAQAVHPGYGFLSENAKFADLLKENNLVFIGPPAQAIRDMGSKSASKKIMTNAGVPVVPGYHGENQDESFLKEQADKMGYPVLIKAVSGGGGKGMRIVENSEEFLEKLGSARREALKSFNDDRVLVERYLTKPRHVEVQVFGDSLGNAVYLHERDCSVQRRHQKVLEEAPAPGLSRQIRENLGMQAVNAAKAVKYVGAGTVEFIMDANTNEFFFMEMNTRLQVEHPVTEMITNLDLVEWQLIVAAGNQIPLQQDEIPMVGHAFEARIYAENPYNNFLPDTGKLVHLRTPLPSSKVRVETAVRKGDSVSVFYDPMIAKLVVHANDRNGALRLLRQCLDEYEIVGMHTNIDFVKALATHPAFIAQELDTGFIQRFKTDLLPEPKALAPQLYAQAAISIVLREDKRDSLLPACYPSDPYSPWSTLTGFRANLAHERSIKFVDQRNGAIVCVKVKYYSHALFDVIVGDDAVKFENVTAHLNEESLLTIDLDGERFQLNVVADGDSIHVFEPRTGHVVIPLASSSFSSASSDSPSDASFKTPMPCKISQILVKDGDKVKKGQTLIILEAMKMEHLIKAPSDGTVEKIYYKVNDLVEEKKLLLKWK